MITKNTNYWKQMGIGLLVAGVIPFFMGVYKIVAYDSGESYFSDPINAYVGGDAYNYIINANYGTGYFVLTGIFVLGAIGCGVMWNFYELRKSMGYIIPDTEKNTQVISAPSVTIEDDESDTVGQ